MEPFEGLVKPTDRPLPPPQMDLNYKMEIVRSIKANEHFWSLQATVYFVADIRY